MLEDAMEDAHGRDGEKAESRSRAVRDLLARPPLGAAAARVLLDTETLDPRAASVLAEAAVDSTLSEHPGFRFLLAVLAALAA